MSNVFFNRNTNVVELGELKDVLSGNFLDGNAVVTVVVKENGVELAGESWPKTLTYLGANGRFATTLSSNIVFDVALESEVIISVSDATSGYVGEFTDNVPAYNRGDN